MFSRYFRDFLLTTLSAEMIKGYTETLLSFQIFLNSSAKFHFVTLSSSVLGRLWVKETASIYYECCSIFFIVEHYTRSVDCLLSLMIDLT
jgi:hypothetical protein